MLLLQSNPVNMDTKGTIESVHIIMWGVHINSLSPKSDQHQISPGNINALYK